MTKRKNDQIENLYLGVYGAIRRSTFEKIQWAREHNRVGEIRHMENFVQQVVDTRARAAIEQETKRTWHNESSKEQAGHVAL